MLDAGTLELNAFVDVTNNGLAGQFNENFQGIPGEDSEIPDFFVGGLSRALGQVFRRNFPDYQFGIQLSDIFHVVTAGWTNN